jgi:hypothetical protein
MNIQIRGAQGSGKTWVVREVMIALGPTQWIAHRIADQPQRNVLYYSHRSISLAVLGSYAYPYGGGADAVGEPGDLYRLADSLWEKKVLLYEGTNFTFDAWWTPKIRNSRVLFLTTPLEVCQRQKEMWFEENEDGESFSKADVEESFLRTQKYLRRLTRRGIACLQVPTSQAIEMIMRWVTRLCTQRVACSSSM